MFHLKIEDPTKAYSKIIGSIHSIFPQICPIYCNKLYID